jgi:ketosteroid isomerase-like protein
MSNHPHRAIADALIAATNKRGADAVVALFTPDAVVDDPSTGQRFDRHPGIGDYIERYLVAYHTVTRLVSIDTRADGRTRLRVDFTGDFGHKIGLLDLTVDAGGLITRIDADLEQEPSCPS